MHQHLKLDPWTPACIALQESTRNTAVHVAHFNGCAVLLNKHTFEPDKAICIPTDKEPNRAFEAVISEARFRRTPETENRDLP